MSTLLDLESRLVLNDPALDVENELILLPENAKEFPVKTSTFSYDKSGSPISVVITHFSDKDQIIITDTGKPGTIFQIRKDRPKSAIVSSGSEFIFTVDLLLGAESDELIIFGRLLAASLKASRPLNLAIGLKDAKATLGSPNSIKSLVDSLTEWFNSAK